MPSFFWGKPTSAMPISEVFLKFTIVLRHVYGGLIFILYYKDVAYLQAMMTIANKEEMNLKLKKLAAVLAAIMMLTLVTACSANEGNAAGSAAKTISVSGSTSVGPLVEKLAEANKGENENAKIEVNQIGSSAGITNAIKGVSEIGMSSRDLKEEEKAEGLKETIIAHDGIAVVVHTANKVGNLTLEQVKEIYTGKITNWSELGGDDAEIVVVSREDGSGSRDAFQEITGFESAELSKDAVVANGNGNIKTTVNSNEQAIGYVSFEYLDDSVSPVMIDGVEATQENVLEGAYSLSRPFIMVYKEDGISEEGKQFIDYILSEDGQKIVSESGAIPVQ